MKIGTTVPQGILIISRVSATVYCLLHSIGC